MTSGLASWADVGFQYNATLTGTSGTSTSTSTTSTYTTSTSNISSNSWSVLAFNTIITSVTGLIVLFL